MSPHFSCTPFRRKQRNNSYRKVFSEIFWGNTLAKKLYALSMMDFEHAGIMETPSSVVYPLHQTSASQPAHVRRRIHHTHHRSPSTSSPHNCQIETIQKISNYSVIIPFSTATAVQPPPPPIHAPRSTHFRHLLPIQHPIHIAESVHHGAIEWFPTEGVE